MSAESSRHFARLVGGGEAIGCSAYVAFAYLADLDRLSPEVARRIADDRAAIYHWYLKEYAARHRPLRVPLSVADRAYLLAPDPELGGWPRVVARFAAIERPELLRGASSETGANALATWWAHDRAPQLGVEDCLIPESFASVAPPSALPTPALLLLTSDVCVVGPVRQRSGLGQAARLSIEALERAGAKVSVLDFEHGFPSPRDAALLADRDGDIAAAGSALIHVNPDMLPTVFAFAGHDLPRRRAGYFAWELDAPASCDFLAFDLIDTIWTHSTFVRNIYASVFEGDVAALGLAMPTQSPSRHSEARATLHRIAGIAPDSFVFLSVFDALSYAARKNPVGAIAAFRAAFPNDPNVALVLKTQNKPVGITGPQAALWRDVEVACNEDRRIRLVDASLSQPEVLALMTGADAFVSLHRSEGWGLGVTEAMQMGTPVIVTAYGGTEDFCTDETAFRVACKLVPVNPDAYVHAEPGRRWAEPEPAAAVAAFRTIRADEALRAARSAAAQRLVAETMSPEVVSRNYGAALERLLAKT